MENEEYNTSLLTHTYSRYESPYNGFQLFFKRNRDFRAARNCYYATEKKGGTFNIIIYFLRSLFVEKGNITAVFFITLHKIALDIQCILIGKMKVILNRNKDYTSFVDDNYRQSVSLND